MLYFVLFKKRVVVIPVEINDGQVRSSTAHIGLTTYTVYKLYESILESVTPEDMQKLEKEHQYWASLGK